MDFFFSSDLVNGLTCPRLLYLAHHGPGRAKPLPWGDDRGAPLKWAAGLYPGVLWVEPGSGDPAERDRATRRLMASARERAVAGGLIVHDGLAAQADLLWPNRDGSWDVSLVLSSSWIRPSSLWKLAFVQHVMEAAGWALRHASVIHANKAYERGAEDFSPEAAFIQQDCMDRTVSLREELPDLLAEFRSVLAAPAPPPLSLRQRCRIDSICPYDPECHGPRPVHWVGDFYRMTRTRRRAFIEAGIEDIRDIPESEKLTPLQKRIHSVLRSGRPYLDPAFPRALKKLPQPLHYLDFETFSPAVPVYPHIAPRRMIPFQWSLHTEHGDGRLEHAAFLAEGDRDPRPDVVRTLLEAISPRGAILTYTHYERQVLLGLKEHRPELADELERLARRCVDLCALVRKHLYHPGFGQGFSLKQVLPALAPGLAYEGLSIGDGQAASSAFANLIPETDPERRRRMRRDLLEYCGRDTLALVVIKRYVMGEPLPTTEQVELTP